MSPKLLKVVTQQTLLMFPFRMPWPNGSTPRACSQDVKFSNICPTAARNMIRHLLW